jgi:lipopolysaccharide/colanic/teichoic acid biosynthesis glycosyltransferase
LTPTYPAKTLPASSADIGLRLVCAVERLVALFILLLFSPLIGLIALAIVVLSGRGPLVRHARVGWQGRPLRMLKFRTMWPFESAREQFRMIEDVAGPPPSMKQAQDSRVTSRFAALCRRYSFDELPQLYHVIRGEMSLVGPRPITQPELDAHYQDCVDEVLSLRPGLTGLWQVMGRSDLSYATRRRLDLILVRNASPALYVTVLLRSIPRVINGKGAY